jgi:hypothetical protein
VAGVEIKNETLENAGLTAFSRVIFMFGIEM